MTQHLVYTIKPNNPQFNFHFKNHCFFMFGVDYTDSKQVNRFLYLMRILNSVHRLFCWFSTTIGNRKNHLPMNDWPFSMCVTRYYYYLNIIPVIHGAPSTNDVNSFNGIPIKASEVFDDTHSGISTRWLTPFSDSMIGGNTGASNAKPFNR